jgi:hypothetical protein
MLKEALKYSKALKAEADRLLADTKIQTLLEEFGRVELGGSYAYDLLVDRDLDFGVAVKEITPEIRSKIAAKLAAQPWAYSVKITDRINFEPLSNFSAPRGLYLGLTIPFPVERWNLDIWFLISDTLPKDEMAELIATATQEQRDTILTKKYELMKSGQKQKGISSAEIYKSTLQSK